MPIYEYVCENCHCIFEIFRQRPGNVETRCPRCGAARPERLISRPGRIGSGITGASCEAGSSVG